MLLSFLVAREKYQAWYVDSVSTVVVLCELFTYKHRPREFGNKIGALLLHWSRKPNRDVLHTWTIKLRHLKGGRELG